MPPAALIHSRRAVALRQAGIEVSLKVTTDGDFGHELGAGLIRRDLDRLSTGASRLGSDNCSYRTLTGFLRNGNRHILMFGPVAARR